MATLDNSDTQRTDGSFTWFETGVNGGVQILSLLRDASSMAPIPYLKQAAGLTVNIIGIIQSVKDNKSDFRRLGRDAASLLIAILHSYHKSENQADWPGTHLQEAINNLIKTLLSIKGFAQKQLDRRLFVRILNYIADGRKIKEYREMLTEATNQFGLSSQLETSDLLRTINMRMKDFLRKPQEPGRPTPHQQKSIDFMEQWKRNADSNLPKRRESRQDTSDEKGSYERDTRRKRESKSRKGTRSSNSEDLPHSQQWPQYSPSYTPGYVGVPMPIGVPSHITNIGSGNVTNKIKTNVGNDNSFKLRIS